MMRGKPKKLRDGWFNDKKRIVSERLYIKLPTYMTLSK
jgi:hypothetical protein